MVAPAASAWPCIYLFGGYCHGNDGAGPPIRRCDDDDFAALVGKQMNKDEEKKVGIVMLVDFTFGH